MKITSLADLEYKCKVKQDFKYILLIHVNQRINRVVPTGDVDVDLKKAMEYLEAWVKDNKDWSIRNTTKESNCDGMVEFINIEIPDFKSKFTKNQWELIEKNEKN